MLRRIRRAVACMLVLVLFAGAVGRTEEALVADVTEGALAFAKEIVFEEEEAADLAEVPEVELPAAAEADSIEAELPMKGSEEELISVPEEDSVEEAPAEVPEEDSIEEAPAEDSEAESVEEPTEEVIPVQEEEEDTEGEASPDEADASEMEELCAMPLMLGMARAGEPMLLSSNTDFDITNNVLGYYYGNDATVEIPSGVVTIDSFAFEDVENMQTVIIPNGVQQIRSSAFTRCTSLSSVVIPESVTSIADDAFLGCGSFTATVDKGSYAHEYCKENKIPFRYNCRQTDDGIQYIVNEGAITVIGYAGSGVNLKIPGALDGLPVTKVEIETNLNLQILALPGSLQQIPDNAFAGWKALRSVSLSEGIQRIGASAFSGCSALQSISLPYSLTELGSGVFANCGTLTATVYKNSSAHTYCTGAEISCEIVHFETADGFQYDLAGDEATIVGYDEKLAAVVVPEKIGENTVAYVEDGVFRGKTQLRSIVFPVNVILTTGSSGFFAGCIALESVTLPNTTISCSVDFYGCTQLKNIYVSSENSNWKSADGVLYDKSGETLIYFPPGRSGSFDVPEGVSIIAAGAFSGSALSRVKLHSGISEIGENAFAGTKNFRAVVREDSYALRYCSNNGIEYQLLTQSVQLSDTHIRAELSEQGLYLNATVLPASAGQELEWSSDNQSVAMVDGGNVTLHGVGRAVITCRTMDGSGVFAQCVIEVTQSAAPTQISLDRESLSLTLDSDPVQLIAKVSDDSKVAWTSSAPEVATVEDGLVTPVGGGVALVRCSAGGASAQCIVIVDGRRAVREIQLNHEKARLDLAKEEILTLTATITPDNATNKAVTWTSSDSSVALVGSDGTVHPRKVGTATISCTAADGSNVHAECTVEIINSAADTKITLSETAIQMKSGETRTLTCTVTPETDVAWSSSNPAVASVQNGTITALGAGVALISCTASNGSGASASCLVTVSDKTLVTAIQLNHSSAKLDLAKEEILTLTATITPDDATNKAVIWTSSDSSVALVGSDGTVHPRKVGTATISCTAADGSGVHAECEIEVINSAAGTKITLSEISIQMKSGETWTLTCTVTPETSVTWASSNPAVASVSDGKITALGAGVALISCTANNGSGASASCLVTVSDKTLVTAIQLNHGSATLDLAKNETLSLTAEITPDDATNKAVTWMSSDSSVALVGSDGTVHPRKVGTVTISCTAADGSDVHAECETEVINSAAGTKITLSEISIQMKSGEMRTLTCTVTPESDVTWSSSNPVVASVQNGKITALGAGVALITCTANNGSGVSASCLVTVDGSVPVTSVTLNRTSATLNRAENEMLALQASVLPTKASNSQLRWSSSDPAVAAVTASGVVIPMGAGKAIITAAALDGSGKEASCSVTVWEQVKPTAVELTPPAVTLNLASGEKCALTAKIVPANASYGGFRWSSSDAGIARVSAGVVTPVSAGIAVITCTADGAAGVQASCIVTVVNSLPVRAIELSEAELRLSVGEAHALYAKILPENADDENVVWSSSDEDVAFVASNGTVVARSAGTALVSCASAGNASVRASCRVTVTNRAAVQEIALNRENLTLNIAAGEVCALTATLKPEGASGEVVWSSTNEAVAVVTGDGLIVPLAEGSASIICTSAENGAVRAVCELRVVRSKLPTNIILFENDVKLDWSTGESRYLQSILLPSDATERALVWHSSNEAVARVEDGVVTPAFVGSAVISCALAADSSVRAACTVQVYASREPDDLHITGQARQSLLLGESMQLGAQLVPANSYSEVQWSSSDETIASVDESGCVIALKEGEAQITAAAENGAADAVRFEIIDPSMPTGVELSEESIFLGAGERIQLEARVLPETAVAELIWESSDAKIAKIDANGRVRGVKKGEAELRVTAVGADGRRFSDEMKIEVRYAPAEVKLNQKRLLLYVGGEGAQLGASVGAKCASALAWSSSDEAVAAVDEDGMIEPIAPGSAIIRCKTFNGKSAKCAVTVSPMPEGIELEEAELNMYPRQSRRLRARLVDGSGAVCAGEISYASSHPERVSVSADGRLTAKTAAPGTAEILLTGPNGLTAQAYVTVCRAPERVELPETRIDLGIGEEYQLYPIIGEDEATQFSFASGNKRVASVDGDGLITAKRVGTAKITVRTHNKKYASLTVRVSAD